jgi:hypothetical protein
MTKRRTVRAIHPRMSFIGVISRFTTGEAAVLAIVAAEVKLRGRCDLSMAEIAARPCAAGAQPNGP